MLPGLTGIGGFTTAASATPSVSRQFVTPTGQAISATSSRQYVAPSGQAVSETQ